MNELLNKISDCVEFGKTDKASPYPPDRKGENGADEFTKQAIEEGIAPNDILSKGLITGMEKVGVKFRANQVFVPQVLMSAKSMKTAMAHLRPFFQSGNIKQKGTFIIGTVAGDMHDIGKNLVSMMIEGNGWEVIDLGTDVRPEKFIETIKAKPGSVVGLSALLTTTMASMEKTVKAIRENTNNTKVLIGGAPVNDNFRAKIDADFYSSNPQSAIEYLNAIST